MGKNLSPESIIRRVREAAAPLAASFGLSVWGVELVAGGRTVVRLYVDAPAAVQDEEDGTGGVLEGVSVDQCAELSRMLGLALDVDEIFSGAWVLEVSSPGFDRLFFEPAQLAAYAGRDIDVTLLEPHPESAGRRRFKGPLKGVDGECFTVEVLFPPAPGTKPEPADVSIDWKMVKKARLVPVFPDTSKPRAGKGVRTSGADGGKQA